MTAPTNTPEVTPTALDWAEQFLAVCGTIDNSPHGRDLLVDLLQHVERNATWQLRDTNTRLNRRCQAAEAALADLQRCNEHLASGAAWCGGSLGRAFLAWEKDQLRQRITELEEALADVCDSIECHTYIRDPKPPETWDAYDFIMAPKWQRVAALLAKPTEPKS